MKSQNIAYTIIFILSIFTYSCKKDSNSTTTTTPTTGPLYLHLHTDVDTNEVEYGTVYVMTGGRKISVTKAQLYISTIQLVRSDNSIYTVPNTVLLKVQEVEPYLVGNIPAGSYSSVRFTIGLDSATNLKSPTVTDSILYNPQMWFNTTAQPDGFVFVNFQGSIDTTTNANGSNLVPFVYMLGTLPNSKVVTMPTQSFEVTGGQAQFVHISIDYNKLFTGVNLTNGSNLMINSKSANSSVLANTISNNIPSMFQYE